MPQKQLASTRRFVRFNLVPQSVIDEEEEEEDEKDGTEDETNVGILCNYALNYMARPQQILSFIE